MFQLSGVHCRVLRFGASDVAFVDLNSKDPPRRADCYNSFNDYDLYYYITAIVYCY